MRRVARGERIVVLGAGAAGLSVAHRLKAKGFASVTVLEASERVGGKCWSVPLGGESYEMGAIGFPGRRNEMLRLAVAHGLPLTFASSYLFFRGSGVTSLPRLSTRLPAEGVRLAGRFAGRLLALQRPGLHRIDPRLGVSMDEWLREHHLTDVGEALQPLVTGLGYGFFADIAAAYALKHIALFRPDAFQLLDGGTQRVWERVAAKLDVRTGHRVHRVERRAEGVRVETERETFVADRLVVATPPKQACAFLDLRAPERRLLETFRTFAYHVVLCDVTGIRPVHYGFFTDAYARLEPGRPVAFARRRPTDDAMVIYSYLDPQRPLSSEEIIAAHEKHLAPFGVRLGTVHRHHTWDYFPHVPGREIAAGFFTDLDELQGATRTFFVGEALGYPTVRHVVTQAHDIVDRFF